MAISPEEAEKWREEAQCYRALYGKYHRLFNLVNREERKQALSRYNDLERREAFERGACNSLLRDSQERIKP